MESVVRRTQFVIWGAHCGSLPARADGIPGLSVGPTNGRPLEQGFVLLELSDAGFLCLDSERLKINPIKNLHSGHYVTPSTAPITTTKTNPLPKEFHHGVWIEPFIQYTVRKATCSLVCVCSAIDLKKSQQQMIFNNLSLGRQSRLWSLSLLVATCASAFQQSAPIQSRILQSTNSGWSYSSLRVATSPTESSSPQAEEDRPEPKLKIQNTFCVTGVAPRTGPLNEAVAQIANMGLKEANDLIEIGAV
jgi:hypothetical protein